MSINVRTRHRLRTIAQAVALLFAGFLCSCSDGLHETANYSLFHEDVAAAEVHTDVTVVSQTDAADSWDVRHSGELATQENSLLWVNSPDWNFSESFANSPTYSNASKYSVAIGRYYSVRNCSGFLLNAFDFVTAHHCNTSATIGSRIHPTFATMTSTGVTSTVRLRQRLSMLGVATTHLDDAVNVLSGAWDCQYIYRPGSRDIVVYQCDPKTIVLSSGIERSLYPGDVWGHLDGTYSAPSESSGVYNLSNNARNESDPLRTLLSPGGEVVSGNDDCAESQYSSCVAQQGADALRGSSGGAALELDSNLVYGVIHGFRACSGDENRNPRDQNWWCNRNLNTRLAQGMEVVPPISGSLPPPSSSSYSVMYGGAGGTLTNQNCLGREALVGLVLSEYQDNYNSGAISVGLLASVCSVVHPTVLRWDQMFVQSPGSYDTNFATTPDASDPNRVRVNRFVNTIDTGSVAPLTQPVVNDLMWEICPSGYAVASLTGRFKYGKVMRLDSAICRHTTSISAPDLTTLIDAGAIETGATSFTTSCPTGNYANGLRLRVGWFLNAVSLRCRPR